MENDKNSLPTIWLPILRCENLASLSRVMQQNWTSVFYLFTDLNFENLGWSWKSTFLGLDVSLSSEYT